MNLLIGVRHATRLVDEATQLNVFRKLKGLCALRGHSSGHWARVAVSQR